MYVPRLCYMRRSVCAPHSLISTFVSRKIKLNILSQLSVKFDCHSLFGGGAGSGTANSISSRQRDRVMVHGHGLRSKKPTIRPRVVVVVLRGGNWRTKTDLAHQT